MGIRDALAGFMMGLRKGPVISVNAAHNMIAATPGLGQVQVVNTLENPTMSNVPTKWGNTFLGPGQPFAGQMDTTRSKDSETEPRSMQYIANINSTITPRISWGLLPFSELRLYAEGVPEVAGTVRLLTEEMKAFIPSIVDTNDKDLDIPELEWMKEKPDRVNPWPVWLSRFLYNVLVYDAPAIYKMRDTTYIGFSRSTKGGRLRKGTAAAQIRLVSTPPVVVEGMVVEEASAHYEWVCHRCGGLTEQLLDKASIETPAVCGHCGASANRKTQTLLKADGDVAVYEHMDTPAPITGLRIIDGSTLFALINEAGEQPVPPAPAFTQVIWGVPRMFLNRNQIWYRPRFLRADSPYGRSFIEDALPAVQLLQKLWEYEKDKYTSGNLSEMGMSCPPGWTSADQILDYEDAYNARFAGNNEERAGRMHFFPNGMEVLAIKEMDFNKEGYDAAVNTIRMAAGVPKSEAGEAPEGMMGGKSFAEAMQSSFYRMGIAPLQTFIEGLFNDIIEENGFTGVYYKLRFPNESMDPEKEETKWSTRFQVGGITRDEYRQGLSMDPIGGEEGKFMVSPGGGQGGEPGAGSLPGAGAAAGMKNPISVKGGGGKSLDVLKNPVTVLRNPVAVNKSMCPDWADPDQFAMGMQDEKEHNDVTGGDPAKIAEIVLAHLKEKPDYYTRLHEVMKRDDTHDGIMVALPIGAASKLTSVITWPQGSEVLPESEMHLTLAYLGDITEQDTGPDSLFAAGEAFAAKHAPITGKLNGIGRFLESHKPGMQCLYLNFDAPGLPELRQELLSFLSQNEYAAKSDHGFTPHVTLAYYPAGQEPQVGSIEPIEVTITHLRCAWGDRVEDYPFGVEGMQKDEGGAAAPVGMTAQNGPNGVYLAGGEEEPSTSSDPLAKFDNVLSKHCGVCAEDDAYWNSPVTVPVEGFRPGQGANISTFVSIGSQPLQPRPAVFKPQSGEKQELVAWAGGPLYKRAEAAYLLDRELAHDEDHYLVPVTWCDTVDGEVGSVQHFVKGGKKKPVAEYAADYVEQAAVLDYIMGQMDRVNKNYLTHPDDDKRPVLIDNDVSFCPDEACKIGSSFIDALAGKPLGEEILEQVYLLIGNPDLWQDIAECLDDPQAANHARARAISLAESGEIPLPPPVPQGPAGGGLKKGWDESEKEKHPHAKDGKFAPKGQGAAGQGGSEDTGEKPAPKGGNTLWDVLNHEDGPDLNLLEDDEKPAVEPGFKGLPKGSPEELEAKYKNGLITWHEYKGMQHGLTQQQIMHMNELYNDDKITYEQFEDAVNSGKMVDEPQAQPAAAAGGKQYESKSGTTPKRPIVEIARWHVEKGKPWNSTNKAHAQDLVNAAIDGTEVRHDYGKASTVYQGDNDDEIRLFKFKGQVQAAYLEGGHRVGSVVIGTSVEHALQLLSAEHGGKAEYKGEAVEPVKSGSTGYSKAGTNAGAITLNAQAQEVLAQGIGYSNASALTTTSTKDLTKKLVTRLGDHKDLISDPSDIDPVAIFSNVGDSKRIKAKAKIAKELSGRSGLSEDQCSNMVQQWAHTSNNNHVDSLMMQVAVAETFGSPLSTWQAEKCKAQGIEVNAKPKEPQPAVEPPKFEHPLLDPAKRKEVVDEITNRVNGIAKKFVERWKEEGGAVGPDVNPYSDENSKRFNNIWEELTDNKLQPGDGTDEQINQAFQGFHSSMRQAMRHVVKGEPFDDGKLNSGIYKTVTANIDALKSDWDEANKPTSSASEPYHQWSRDENNKFIKAMYDNTQDHFKEMGYQPDDEITLFRGVDKKIPGAAVGKVVKTSGNACESWSLSPRVANNFGSGGHVLMTNVKVRDILGSFESGFGCYNEAEVVVMNGHLGTALVVKKG